MFDNVVVLSPHTDDAELGCGGTVSKLIGTGAEITFLVFSDCGKERNREEVQQSAKLLGIKKCHILDFEVRRFPRDRQRILQVLYDFNKTEHPNLVLTPSTQDIHQDHQTVTSEAIRAFRESSILGYEMPWNNITFTANAFIKLGEEDVKHKLAALRVYESQKDKYYFKEDFLKGALRTRGTQIKEEYAEAFEVMRMILI